MAGPDYGIWATCSPAIHRNGSTSSLHTHHDHVAGVPSFKRAYMAGTRVDFWAGHLPTETPLQEVMRRLMQAPLFPVPIDRLSDCRFNSLVRGAPIQPGPGIELTP